MKIRTQLILICFLLAVVPLTAIVVYSYRSSRQALQEAYQTEANRLTGQMDRRLALIKSDLEERLAEVSALPMLSSTSTSQPDVRNILATMGDAASLVDSIEIRPFRPLPPQVAENVPPKSRPMAPQAPPAPGDFGTRIADNVMKDVAKKVSKEAAAEMAADADEENADESEKSVDDEKMPIVIDLPAPALQAVKRFTLTDEQRRQLDQIQKMGMELGLRGKQMTPAERELLEKQLADTQKTFETQMKLRSEEFDAQHVNVMLKSREMARTMAKEMRATQAKQRMATQHAGGPVPPEPPPTAPFTMATPPPVPGVATSPSVASMAPVAATAPAAAVAPAPAPSAHTITTADRVRLSEKEKQTRLVFGQRFNAPLRQQGKVVGHIQAHVSTEEVIRRVLGVESEDRTEIAFALDRDGNLYTRSPEEKQTLAGLGVPQRVAKNESLATIPNWVVVLNRDPQSGLRIGVARPVGDTFEAMRRTAAKNFGFGMGVVLLLLFGIAPIASHMTRDVNAVTRGAERVAQGDLMTRVPVGSTKSEIGQLAVAFNRMAEDLSLQQQRIVTQERQRQEQSLQQRLLEVEYARKSSELEEARRFQLSLLPKDVPRHEHFDLAVFTRTATEVGGDYYDFHHGPNGVLSATVGDATGHGARAGTMVTVIKALFSGYASDEPPSVFLREASEKVKRMDLPRMAMALLVARLEHVEANVAAAGDSVGGSQLSVTGAADATANRQPTADNQEDAKGRLRVTLASAGMPPVYVHRAASDTVDEVALHATPLGTLGDDYKDAVIELASGDTMLLMTDGFPELLQGSNGTSQQRGYTGAMEDFAVAAKAADVDGVIASLETSVQRWHGDTAPNDDVTFVVVRARA
jgi:serine phosphatase RsbU (regulator of sigma subunit)